MELPQQACDGEGRADSWISMDVMDKRAKAAEQYVRKLSVNTVLNLVSFLDAGLDAIEGLARAFDEALDARTEPWDLCELAKAANSPACFQIADGQALCSVTKEVLTKSMANVKSDHMPSRARFIKVIESLLKLKRTAGHIGAILGIAIVVPNGVAWTTRQAYCERAKEFFRVQDIKLKAIVKAKLDEICDSPATPPATPPPAPTTPIVAAPTTEVVVLPPDAAAVLGDVD
jgi:hypothetical protein